MKQQSLKNSEKCSVTDILNGHLHPEPSSAQWMTSAHRFWRPCQGFSRLVEVLKGLAVIPAAEISVFLQLEYLFLTHPKEVTAATLKTRPVAMPCVTTRKEQSPNPLAADCGWIMTFIPQGDLQAHLTQFIQAFLWICCKGSAICVSRER